MVIATYKSDSLQQTLVWDKFVRLFHWSLMTCFLAATLLPDDGDSLHRWLGYCALALVLARIVYGFTGSYYARFRQFVPTPKSLVAYLAVLLRGTEHRYLGHNPAGAVMIMLLLVGVISAAVTGWLLTTDWFWGNEMMETLHETAAYGTLSLVILHVAGVIYSSMRHRENLVWAMIVGTKRH